MKKDLSVSIRLLFAGLSGVGVALVMLLDLDIGNYGEAVAFYGLSGLCFAAGVLYPNVRLADFVLLRIGALVFASAVSYWAAITMAIDGPWSGGFGGPGSDITAYTSASIVGAAIVMTALIPACPVKSSVRYFLYGLAAALLGGLVTSFTLHEGDFFVMATGYVGWHSLICLAIYLGTRRERLSYQAIP